MSLTLDPAAGLEVAADAVARAVAAGADQAKVTHSYSEQFEVNFDTNDVTLIRTTVGDTVSLTVFDGTRKGTATITGRSHDLVEGAVADALAAARGGSPDPANVLPESATGLSPAAGDDGDTEPDRETMVDAVLAHLRRLADDYPQLRVDSSAYTFGTAWTTYADSNDRALTARRGRYSLSTMVTGRDDVKAASTSFNYTGVVGREHFDTLTDLGPVQQLIADTLASFDTRPVPATFTGDVIFTPSSLMTLVGTVLGALGGTSLIRKTSPFRDSLGEAVAAPGFSLLHRPAELAGAAPFDADGFANTDLDIISDGVLTNFLVDWYSSVALGRERTTSQADLVVAPGDTSLADIIAGTEEGIVLGRFSGGMPSANLDFSGVAKNSFYVKDGEIRHPVSETMVAGSFLAGLKAIKAISSETVDNGGSRFPWLSMGGVTISTK